ncbi:MAG: hypothetical protein LBM74_10460 [Oscillospiraceae bacterium]|jgi:hypothetical protein|nr:hypothetical protein [Oscillospiraceae bacterium]
MKRIIALTLALLCAYAAPAMMAHGETIRILEMGYQNSETFYQAKIPTTVTVFMRDGVVIRKPASEPNLSEAERTSDHFSFSPNTDPEEFPTLQSRAFAYFAPLHPGFAIQRRWENYTPEYERLYTQLLTGTVEADIIHYKNLALKELYEAGALVDLATDAPLMEAVKTHASVMHLLGDGEHLFAFPTRLMPRILNVFQPDLYRTLQPMPDDETWQWSDLFALADAVEAYNEQHDPDIYLLRTVDRSPTWLHQYVHNEAFASDGAPPDEAALRSLLSDWKDLSDRNLVTWMIDMVLNQEDLERCLFAEAQDASVYLAQQEGILLPPVYRQGIARTEVDASYYVVSADSPYVAECLDLLTLMADPEIYLQSSYFYHYAWLLNEDEGATALPLSVVITPITIAKWNEAIRTGYTLNGSELYAAVEEVFTAFMADQIGLEECVQQIIGRINMLTGE